MPAESRPVRILVVDEEETFTHVVRLALELEGWEVKVVHSAADAIADRSRPDIVLLDMMLPDGLGTDVVAALRSAGSRAVVVFVTGRAEHEERAAAYAAGADGYLTKPFSLEEVVDHLQMIVRRLGLAATSRVAGDLVLDVDAGMAWRADELLPLTSLEFELLRELVEHRGARRSTGELVRAVTARGIRVPREFVARMLERIRVAVNGVGRPLLVGDEAGWQVG
ncbi:response regulator transcription factor [Pseudolysinimonas sp.]|jgi:two-component system OmpR family response regulator|uniref:response regulator transcription factor n=1 Tax=Pseudolysinimonas sp. TaxID=2680009 RepID=UPI003785137C